MTTRKPAWLYRPFGAELATEAYVLMLEDSQVTDADLEQVAKLSSLRGLVLSRTAVTDVGLQKLATLTELVQLTARRTSMVHGPDLSKMRNLEDLDYGFTSVHLIDTQGLTKLKSLGLRSTEIDDETIAALSPLPSLKTLDIAGAPGDSIDITDDGVLLLTKEKYPKLSTLYLYQTRVTDDAIAELKKRFPGLKVFRWPRGGLSL